MKVKKMVQEMVCPASPSGGGRVMKLSLYDRIIQPIYTPVVIFFKEKLPKGDDTVGLLKASMAQALALFYPCAGRLRELCNGDLEIECNDAGALLVEAWVDASYSDFSPTFQPHPDFALLVPAVDLAAPAVIPVLAQITHFECGRICIGVEFQHHVCDGLAMSHFLSSWAMSSKSIALENKELVQPNIPQPYFDRSCLKPNPLPSPIFNHPEYQINPPGILPGGTSKILSFTPSYIDVLRKKARAGLTPTYTRFEILAAHLWRGILLSKGFPPHQDIRFAMAVDGRKRFNPPLPQGYFGNAVFVGYIETTVGEVVQNPLSFAADLIKDSIAKVSDAHMRSVLDWIAKQESPKSVRPSFCLPSIAVSINSWVRFPLYDLDFGWGKPSFVRTPIPPVEGLILLLPSPLGEGHVDALVGLQEDHMHKLEEYIKDA